MREILATEETCEREGLNFWHLGPENGERPDVDIIAVQGLDTNPYYTWVWKDDNDKQDKSKHVMWLRDILPKDLPNARIASFSYSFPIISKGKTSNLYEVANQLLRKLQSHRDQDVCQRPIVLIGHSLGGLVICKAALLALTQSEKFADISKSIAGVIFLGTPFAGSDFANLGHFCPDAAAKQIGLDKDILHFLSRNGREVWEVSDEFCKAHQHLDISCFYENTTTDYGPLLQKYKTVDVQSAIPLGKDMMFLNANHSRLNKYSGVGDNNYQDVANVIKKMARQGPEIVKARFKSAVTKSGPRLFWRVPKTLSGLFTGRSDVLEDMKKGLLKHDHSGQKIYVLTGDGGLGKSEICLKFIDEVKEHFVGIAFLDVSSERTAEKGLVELARSCRLGATDLTSAKDALSSIEEQCLLILDNADDISIDYRDFAPTAPNWTVVITSRNHETGRLKTVQHYDLQSLQQSECTNLLLKAAGISADEWVNNEEAAKEVVQCLHSHTLALVIAGAYVQSKKCNLSQYSSRFQNEPAQLMNWKPSQGAPPHGSVAATFQMSFDTLDASNQQGQDARRILDLLSVLHFTPFSTKVFKRAWDHAHGIQKQRRKSEDKTAKRNALVKGIFQVMRERTFDAVKDYLEGQEICMALMDKLPGFLPLIEQQWNFARLDSALELLSQLALIKYSGMAEEYPTISLHPLVHSWAWERLNDSQQQEAWLTAGSVIALSSMNPESRSNPEAHLKPHIRSFAQKNIEHNFSGVDSGATEEIYSLCADLLLLLREDDELEDFLNKTFARLAKAGKSGNEVSLSLRKVRAKNLVNLSKLQEGLQEWEAIVAFEHTFNGLRKTTKIERALSRRELADALFTNVDRSRAIALHEQVVETCGNHLPETSPIRLESQSRLAKAYSLEGDSERAIPLFERVIGIQKQVLPQSQPELLISMHELGRAYRYNGQLSDSLSTFEHVLRVREEILAETHPELLASQTELGDAYRDDGRIEKSIELLEHAAKIRSETLEETHLERLYTENDLAESYLAAGRFEQAIRLEEHVVQVHRRILPADHVNRRVSEYLLSCCYEAKEEHDKEETQKSHRVDAQIKSIERAMTGGLKEASSFGHSLARAFGKLWK